MSKDTVVKVVESEVRGCLSTSSPFDEGVHWKHMVLFVVLSLVIAIPGTDCDGLACRWTSEVT